MESKSPKAIRLPGRNTSVTAPGCRGSHDHGARKIGQGTYLCQSQRPFRASWMLVSHGPSRAPIVSASDIATCLAGMTASVGFD